MRHRTIDKDEKVFVDEPTQRVLLNELELAKDNRQYTRIDELELELERNRKKSK